MEELVMPYMQGALRLGDEYDEHIALLERLLGDDAIIRDGHPGEKPSCGRDDAKEPVGKAPTAK